MKLQTRIDGWEGLSAALAEIGDGATLAREIGAVAEDIRRRAAANLADGVPPDDRSGALAQSLTVAPTADGSGYTVSTPLDYGWHLEFGSRSRPALPWLLPAAEETRPALLERLTDRLNGTLAGALRRSR